MVGLVRGLVEWVPTSLGTIVTVEYLAWITDTQTGWGVTNGPEIGLWTAVVAVLLLGRSRLDPTERE